MDSFWDEEATAETHRNAEWSKISSEFTTSGYREGITAGKESALQEGFDSGFADVGTPIGREVGMLRGTIAAIIAFLSSNLYSDKQESLLAEAQAIGSQLSKIRFSDIAPRDLEAEAHAREHLEMDSDEKMEENEELTAKRNMEGLEDMLARLSADSVAGSGERKLGMEDVKELKWMTGELCKRMGLKVQVESS
ncbi:hypothetical protein BDP27DRAFT_143595 [Rhodocollybia butyracea]|uniref:Protein YAE1 n=1 Tax=Rhodocollybia butyracea TaxID=206335 RepID=A0A9P5UCZ1_9AGAR|nr:hypothetical protein BDP27DRAFT_143595 [Rhodocollybia butyracea]